jgi:hypothetical protein
MIIVGAQNIAGDAISNVPEHHDAPAPPPSKGQQLAWRSVQGKTTSVAPSTQLALCRLPLGTSPTRPATITSFTRHPCSPQKDPCKFVPTLLKSPPISRHTASPLQPPQKDPIMHGMLFVMSSVKVLRLAVWVPDNPLLT